MEALRELLGDHAPALDRFAAAAQHSRGWPGTLLGMYRPPTDGPPPRVGMDWEELRRAGDRWQLAFAKALSDYAERGERLNPRLFRGYVRTAVDEVLQPKTNGTGPRSPPRRTGRGGPADAQEYTPTTEFPGFNG